MYKQTNGDKKYILLILVSSLLEFLEYQEQETHCFSILLKKCIMLWNLSQISLLPGNKILI